MKDAIPIITGNFKPLRFVLRSKTDLWEPTLEQINKRDYDYVKLHRMSTYFDVGIAPYSLGVCFDGTLVLPALPEFHERSRALVLFNATLTELLLGGIYCEAVTPDDIGYGILSFEAYTRIHGGGSGPSISFHRAARQKHIGTLDVIRLLNPESITVEELQESLEAGRKLVNKLGELPREQVLYGTTFYVRQQWVEALLHMWTITERIVELAWQKFVVSMDEVSSKKRRAFLEDHRTWPVSTKLEILFQKNLLPATTYGILDEVRKARNEFVHRGVPPTHDAALKSLRGCFEFASLYASEFKQVELFEKVVTQVMARCEPELFPQKTRFEASEVTHWLELPPLPGDDKWGDREYEIIDELRLRPLSNSFTDHPGESLKKGH